MVAFYAWSSVAAGAFTPDPASWSPADCRTFGLMVTEGPVDCGYVTVPRRHEAPDGAAIRLAVVVIGAAADNTLYQSFGDAKPFPEGAERAAINAKFDALFDAMKQTEVLKPSIGTAMPGHSLPEGTESGLEPVAEPAE